MKIALRLSAGLLALLALVFIGGGIYLKSTAPVYSGTQKLIGLKADVEVLYDQYGVPHIYAQNEEDAYFALGYVHAQDRLFQMEMLRRAASGRLSEVFGPDLLKVDLLFRALGLNPFAKEHTKKFLSSDTAAFQRAALAYQQGINQYVATGKTPIEFTLTGIPKTAFTPEDIYLAIGFMSLSFAEALRADPVLQQIKTEWGSEYLRAFSIQLPESAERIPNHFGQPKPHLAPLVSFLNESLGKLPVPLWQGSNGWAVSGDKTASGFPILGNDTHIPFGQPTVWYEAHIEYPGYRFYGHFMAGIPFGVLGNNGFCGWGLTMFENDDIDFFLETTDPAHLGQVRFKDQWETMAVRVETIHIKDRPDTVLEVKTTRHGPVINALVDHVGQGSPVSLWWTLLHEENTTLQGVYGLNHAQRFEEAEKAVSIIPAPGLNIMYADRDKNIAWWAVAKLPIRPAHVEPKLFLNGASGLDEYLGNYSFSQNPHSINPPSGYVYSANNQPDSVEGVLYPGYYFPNGRASRIKALLEQDQKWTSEMMKPIFLDEHSNPYPEIAKGISTVLKSLPNKTYAPLISALDQWDGHHRTTDMGPSVFYNMLSQVYFMAMKDEIGVTALKAILRTSITKNSYAMFIADDTSPWWDHVGTKDKKETRQDIFAQAAEQTLRLLNLHGGKSPTDWSWGKIHTLTHAHPLGKVKPLDRWFNVGPFSVEGGNEVINNLNFELDTTGLFPVFAGPALRKVTDFGHVQQGETISPSGQSGNVMSPFYDDQAGMYATGQFRYMWMDRKDIEAHVMGRLTLQAP